MANPEIKFANTEDKIKWDSFIEENNGTIFQTFGWKEVIEKTFGYKPYYLYAEDNGIKAVLPCFFVKSRLFGNKLISVPCGGDAAGPLGEIPASKTLVNKLVELGTKLKISQIEIHNIKQEHIPDGSGFIKPWDYFSFILNLSKSSDAIFKDFHKHLRNGIRKAEKNKVEIKEIKNEQDLKIFYKIYQRSMHVLGTPPLPFNFFENIFEIIGPKVKFYLAEYKNKPIVGGIFILEKERVRWLIGSNLAEYRQLNSTSLMLWECIKWAVVNNCKYFDFGGSRPNSGNFEFKKRFGVEIISRDWRYKFFNKSEITDPRTEKFQTYSRIWKKLPLPLCNLVGPYIRKSMGR